MPRSLTTWPDTDGQASSTIFLRGSCLRETGYCLFLRGSSRCRSCGSSWWARWMTSSGRLSSRSEATRSVSFPYDERGRRRCPGMKQSVVIDNETFDAVVGSSEVELTPTPVAGMSFRPGGLERSPWDIEGPTRTRDRTTRPRRRSSIGPRVGGEGDARLSIRCQDEKTCSDGLGTRQDGVQPGLRDDFQLPSDLGLKLTPHPYARNAR